MINKKMHIVNGLQCNNKVTTNPAGAPGVKNRQVACRINLHK